MAKKVLKDPSLEIKCENVHDDTHVAGFLNRIGILKRNDKLCDVVLIAGDDGKRILSHRVVLAGSCAYFFTMFTGSLRESTEKEVTINGISGEVLEIMVHYLYTGSIELREDIIKMIIKNADMMQLDSVVEICCNFLIRNLHSQNCIENMLFALHMGFATILDASLELIYRSFMEVSATEEFLNLEFEQLIKIISNDNLCVPSENVVFDAVKKWLEYLPECRRKFTDKLFSYVRLHLLTPAYIVNNLESLSKSVSVKMLVIGALKYHLPDENCLLTTGIARPRTGYFHLIAYYLVEDSVKIVKLNRTTSTWSEWFSPSIVQCFSEVTAMNGQLIFYGTHVFSSNEIVSCDWSTRELKSLQTLTSERYGHTIIAHKHSLYVIGGYNSNNECLGIVEKLNSESENWVACASMSIRRANAAVCAIDNKLYVLGGHRDDCYYSFSSVECFLTDTGKWKDVAPMKKARNKLGVAAVNGLLYAFGGCDEGNFFERYDPLTDKWTMVVHFSIYISSNNSVGEYDVAHNVWKYIDYPNVPVHKSLTIKLLTIRGSISKDQNNK